MSKGGCVGRGRGKGQLLRPKTRSKSLEVGNRVFDFLTQVLDGKPAAGQMRRHRPCLISSEFG
jgi:hypothetical protein